MKGVKERVFNGFFRKIIPVFICLSIVAVPFSAYAINQDLVDDEIFWIDKGNEIYYSNDDYFEGFSKYIVDEDEGCFYLFTRFTDYRIDRESNENIAFAFTIHNDSNSYFFRVDKDGLVNSYSQNTLDSIDIYYNFSEASCKKQGGGVFVAIELKNKTDRMLNNFISCEYSCGRNVTYNLINDVSLDMYVPTTAKTTVQKTTKQTTQKTVKDTTKSNTSDSGKTVTEKTAKAKTTKESSTKFEGSGVKSSSSSKSNSTKFNSVKGNDQTDALRTEEDVAITDSENIVEFEQENDAINIVEQSEKSQLSSQAKLMIVIFTVLLVVGIACVIIGTVNGKKNKKEAD